MTYAPNSPPGVYDHIARECSTCRETRPFYRPYKSTDPFRCTGCEQPERGAFADDKPAVHTPNLAAELVVAREREAGAVRENGAGLPELPGWTWRGSAMAEHPSGAEIRERDNGAKWAWWAGQGETCGEHQWKDSPVEAAAAALGYTIERGRALDIWTWRNAALQCGSFASAEAAALDALRHAQQQRDACAILPVRAQEVSGSTPEPASTAAGVEARIGERGVGPVSQVAAGRAGASTSEQPRVAALRAQFAENDETEECIEAARQQERERMQAEIAELKEQLFHAEMNGDVIMTIRAELKERFGVEAGFFDDVVHLAIAKAIEGVRAELAEVQEAHKEALAELRRVLGERDALKRELAALCGNGSYRGGESD